MPLGQEINAVTHDTMVREEHDIMSFNGFMILAIMCLRLKEGHWNVILQPNRHRISEVLLAEVCGHITTLKD